MKENQRALTLTDVLFIIVIAVILVVAGILLPMLGRSREEARRNNCASNLKQLGKAMASYREENFGYFPFSWQRGGDAEPAGTGGANAAMAATSLGNLCPRYVHDAQLFKCPSTEDMPFFVLNLPLECRSANPTALPRGMQPVGSNVTLLNSSYGYDPRVSPRAAANQALMADMDGTWGPRHDASTQNHDGGQNVLYVDGHVAWKGTNFCSSDPNDNIFAEDAWDADTDTYLLSKDAGLGTSFDGYKHLHYPQ